VKGVTAEGLYNFPVQPWSLCAKAMRLSSDTDGGLSTFYAFGLEHVGALADFFLSLNKGVFL